MLRASRIYGRSSLSASHRASPSLRRLYVRPSRVTRARLGSLACAGDLVLQQCPWDESQGAEVSEILQSSVFDDEILMKRLTSGGAAVENAMAAWHAADDGCRGDARTQGLLRLVRAALAAAPDPQYSVTDGSGLLQQPRAAAESAAPVAEALQPTARSRTARRRAVDVAVAVLTPATVPSPGAPVTACAAQPSDLLGGSGSTPAEMLFSGAIIMTHYAPAAERRSGLRGDRLAACGSLLRARVRRRF